MTRNDMWSKIWAIQSTMEKRKYDRNLIWTDDICFINTVDMLEKELQYCKEFNLVNQIREIEYRISMAKWILLSKKYIISLDPVMFDCIANKKFTKQEIEAAKKESRKHNWLAFLIIVTIPTAIYYLLN